MRIHAEPLKRFVTAIFTAAGCRPPEPEKISQHLVEANLAGHDSHGVIRIPSYVEWVRTGKLVPNQHLHVVAENEGFALVDGQSGFGQVLGEEAMELGIRKCARHGVAVVALRNSGHLGRIGDWALMATAANLISLHFVNTSGAGILAAPFGGIQRRLSANPIAAGVPVKGGSPLIVDLSTCAIAEGKIRVALNKGVPVPDHCLVDALGQPTNDPKVFYGPPPGAILPVGGHKGYCLSLLVEMLAGALTGGSCSNPQTTRLVNNMLTILLDPAFFQADEEFYPEVQRFVAYVKSAEKASADGEILMPGEPEERTRTRRLQEGIDLDDNTWGQLLETCRSLGITPATVPV